MQRIRTKTGKEIRLSTRIALLHTKKQQLMIVQNVKFVGSPKNHVEELISFLSLRGCRVIPLALLKVLYPVSRINRFSPSGPDKVRLSDDASQSLVCDRRRERMGCPGNGC